MRLVVGCPIYNREWILNRWLEHLKEWEGHGVELYFCFVYTPSWDLTDRIIFSLPPDKTLTAHFPGPGGERGWEQRARVERLAEARNRLKHLARVGLAKWGARYFLSLDSDILVQPWGMSRLLFNDLQGKDAVSPLVYLGERESNAFYYPKPEKPARRIKPLDALQRADVLCAAILMTEKVVNDPRVVYGFDSLGEDFFWSAAARKCRYDLALDSRVKWKHVMRKNQLDQEDRRIGW